MPVARRPSERAGVAVRAVRGDTAAVSAGGARPCTRAQHRSPSRYGVRRTRCSAACRARDAPRLCGRNRRRLRCPVSIRAARLPPARAPRLAFGASPARPPAPDLPLFRACARSPHSPRSRPAETCCAVTAARPHICSGAASRLTRRHGHAPSCPRAYARALVHASAVGSGARPLRRAQQTSAPRATSTAAVSMSAATAPAAVAIASPPARPPTVVCRCRA